MDIVFYVLKSFGYETIVFLVITEEVIVEVHYFSNKFWLNTCIQKVGFNIYVCTSVMSTYVFYDIYDLDTYYDYDDQNMSLTSVIFNSSCESILLRNVVFDLLILVLHSVESID